MAKTTLPPWLAPVAPLVVFLVMTQVEASLPHLYLLLYPIKILLVALLLWFLRPALGQGENRSRLWIVLALGAGVILGLLWIPLDHISPHFAFLGKRGAYDPFREIPDVGVRTAFLLVRFLGLVVIVPIMEEVFYRGFLLQIVTDPDHWKRVSIGTFTTAAFAANVALFALSHPEWLAAAVFAAAMCLLVRQTKDLRAPILAHAVTNLVLGILILSKGYWGYW